MVSNSCFPLLRSERAGISCVVPKGDWLRKLGLGESAACLGNKASICIRVPDCGALAYVVSMTGPVAITSANISGGDDSIHHSMVVDTLGEFCYICVCSSVWRACRHRMFKC